MKPGAFDPEEILRKYSHAHCFHLFTGPRMQVIPDGHVVEKCCRCEKTKTTHRDHVGAGDPLWLRGHG